MPGMPWIYYRENTDPVEICNIDLSCMRIQLIGSHDKEVVTFKHFTPPQRQGRLPWVTSDLDQRILSLSKYGVKAMDDKKQRVYGRHPLHHIANITYYEDTYGKHMIALRLARPGGRQGADNNELIIYECTDEVNFNMPQWWVCIK